MTPSRDDALKLLTLDLISPARRVEQHQIDALTDADWTEILRMARQHRIGPMMRWQLQHAHPHIRVPPRVAEELAKQFKAWTIRNMVIQRELLRVHGILEAAGIPHVFLKGAHLAYCVYPHPGLRPLRDLDILVPADRASAAFKALVDQGCSTSRTAGEPTPAAKPQDHFQHLPALYSNGVAVELHHRVFHLDDRGRNAEDPSQTAEYWDRCAPSGLPALGNARFPSATDNLHHLVVHGVYDHLLCVGPLLLSDVAFVQRTGHIDWSLLQRISTRHRSVTAMQLVLSLVEEHWGGDFGGASLAIPCQPTVGVHSGAGETGSTQWTRLIRLLMRDEAFVSEARLLARLRRAGNLRAKLSVMASTLFRPAEVMEAETDEVRSRRDRISALISWWIAKLQRQIITKRILRRAPGKARLVEEIALLIEEVEWDKATASGRESKAGPGNTVWSGGE